MIDKLKDAISHAREVAKEQREKASFDTDNERYRMSESEKVACLECAREHEKLAFWLEELQERREAEKKLKETLEDMSGRLKDSLFGDGIRFALKLIDKSRKRDCESEDN